MSDLVKQLDRKDLLLAVWAAEFARRMNGGAEAIVPGAVLRIMTERAAESADRLVDALRLLIEVEFRPIEVDGRGYMTWEAFVDCCQRGNLVDDDGHGELATSDRHVSNVRVESSDGRDSRYVRPAWATHVCWYNR